VQRQRRHDLLLTQKGEVQVDVSGKKAVVFGGTSGIGLATVRQLAGLGASVIALSRNPDKAGDLPDNVTVQACDTCDREAVQTFFSSLGAIDILVSAATGGSRAIGPFMEMDLDGYQASFAKLWGYTNVVRYGANNVADDGAIVLVSGTPARYCNPGQVALSSVGGAVEALVRAVAKEIAPKRINTLSPGLIDTPMVPLQGAERDAHYAKLTGKYLIPRAGTPEEVAQGILFLIQNDYVTGVTLDVDGGLLLS